MSARCRKCHAPVIRAETTPSRGSERILLDVRPSPAGGFVVRRVLAGKAVAVHKRDARAGEVIFAAHTCPSAAGGAS